MPIDPLTGIRFSTTNTIFDPYGARNERGRKSFPASIKHAAEEKARTSKGYKCAHCKKVYADRGLFDIGHLNGKNWDNKPENCGLLCRSCNVNQGKHHIRKYQQLKERVGKNAELRLKPAKKKRRAKKSSSKSYDPFGLQSYRKNSGFF